MFKIRNESKYSLSYATEGSAGFDIRNNGDVVNIAPNSIVKIPTGLFVDCLEIVNVELQIRSRSGLSLKGIVVSNSPGTVDCDFKGEIMVILHNTSNNYWFINEGDKVAQGVLCPILKVEGIIIDSTVRGEGGFGSTGV